MKPFQYVAAKTAEKALAVLAENAPNARPIAGGTDLLVELKAHPSPPQILVDVSTIPDFRGIEVNEHGLRIGSMVTHSEIIASPLIAQHTPAIATAAATIGAVQTRNLGTIGGNLANAVPSLDIVTPLMVLDALVTVASTQGRRQVPIEEFFLGPRRTVLEADELLVEIVIPSRCLGKAAAFRKFGLRKGQALSLVNVAASVGLDSSNNAFAETRIALAAVAPTPIRAPKAEAFLDGASVDRAALDEAAGIAVTEAKPIDDFRASARYRKDLIKVLTRRALDEALTAAEAAG